MARALGEASQALDLGQRLFGAGKVTAFDELGLYTFLLRSHSPEALHALHATTLGRVAAYDATRGAELVQTLEAYFASRCSPDATAKRLHLHRNSLLYRLRRIEEIAGVRLEDPETRLLLHLALRVGQVLPFVQSAQTNA
jgi:purine catabolism regulator